MREHTIKLYTYDELTDYAKGKALEQFFDINIDYDWWEEDYRVILQKDYEYLTSKEAIEEAIRCNEYEFTEDGKLFN